MQSATFIHQLALFNEYTYPHLWWGTLGTHKFFLNKSIKAVGEGLFTGQMSFLRPSQCRHLLQSNNNNHHFVVITQVNLCYLAHSNKELQGVVEAQFHCLHALPDGN